MIKYLNLIEKKLNKKAKVKKLKLQLGDVVKTHGDNKKIKKYLGNHIFKKIDLGINEFIEWFKNHSYK